MGCQVVNLLSGIVPYLPEDVENYTRRHWWKGLTLSDLFDRACDTHPDKEGFVDTVNQYTYGQAREMVDRLAIALMNLGIKSTARILIQLPNWNEFVFAYFACQKIGAITVLLIDRYRQYEINQMIKLTGATGWIVPTTYKKTDFIPIIDDVLAENSQIKHIITVRGTHDRPGFYSLEKLIENTQLTESVLQKLSDRNPDAMQVAHMGPTGGTTGDPKIVPRIHNSLVCSVEYSSLSWDQHCEDSNLIAGPIGHDLSFTKCFMGSIITVGKVVFLDNTDNRAICETIEKEKITSIVWVPTLAQRLLGYEKLDQYDLSSLRKMHVGGGASHPEMIHNVMKRLRMKFYNGYGGTEGMTTVTRSIDDFETICHTVGRPTFPHDVYKVVNHIGDEQPANMPGELILKGPGVFSGYFNNPTENARVFTKDGFFRTGDIAKIDEKGYITLTGRFKEMINRGGESISATVIERLINQHPDVSVVAVVSMPDPVMGEKACAYIEPVEGKKLNSEIIIGFLKEKKASVLELPERIEFVEKMLYTKAQKLDKKAIREDIRMKLETEKKL